MTFSFTCVPSAKAFTALLHQEPQRFSASISLAHGPRLSCQCLRMHGINALEAVRYRSSFFRTGCPSSAIERYGRTCPSRSVHKRHELQRGTASGHSFRMLKGTQATFCARSWRSWRKGRSCSGARPRCRRCRGTTTGRSCWAASPRAPTTAGAPLQTSPPGAAQLSTPAVALR